MRYFASILLPHLINCSLLFLTISMCSCQFPREDIGKDHRDVHGSTGHQSPPIEKLSTERSELLRRNIVSGRNEEVKRALLAGADLFPSRGWAISPLDVAVATGNMEIVEFLVNRMHVYYDRYLPVYQISLVGMAIQEDHLEIASFLLERGANPNLGRCVLFVPSLSGDPPLGDDSKKMAKLWSLLLDKNLNPYVRRQEDGVSLLHHVYITASGDIVRRLVEYGLDVDVKDRHGMVPIQYASWSPFRREPSVAKSVESVHIVFDLTVVESLLKEGANPNIVDRDGMTALDMVFYGAEKYGRYGGKSSPEFASLVSLLREYGAVRAGGE